MRVREEPIATHRDATAIAARPCAGRDSGFALARPVRSSRWFANNAAHHMDGAANR